MVEDRFFSLIELYYLLLFRRNKGDIPSSPYESWEGKVVGTEGQGLRVREGPGVGYNQVGSLSDGDHVTVIGEDGGWYKIGDNRWVDGSYIERV